MGRLVIDGNSVYEIDEECVRSRRVPWECEIYGYLDGEPDEIWEVPEKWEKNKAKTEKGR